MRGLLDYLRCLLGEPVSGEDFVGYLYGVLAHPSFAQSFFDQLGTCEIRVPMTKDTRLFRQVSDLGRKLLWLHTFGERFAPATGPRRIDGEARCREAVQGVTSDYPDSYSYNEETKLLRVGSGAFAPVSPEVFGFEVSGLKVVRSWLDYRMKEGAGRRSSPLDDIRPARWTDQFTTELLELLHTLEATLETYAEQRLLLEELFAGDCVQARDLPPVPDEMRKGPKQTGSAAPQKDLYATDG